MRAAGAETGRRRACALTAPRLRAGTQAWEHTNTHIVHTHEAHMIKDTNIHTNNETHAHTRKRTHCCPHARTHTRAPESWQVRSYLCPICARRQADTYSLAPVLRRATPARVCGACASRLMPPRSAFQRLELQQDRWDGARVILRAHQPRRAVRLPPARPPCPLRLRPPAGRSAPPSAPGACAPTCGGALMRDARHAGARRRWARALRSQLVRRE